MTNLDSILKKQRHYFANKGLSSHSYGFPSSHVWMWELNYNESWALKNWCFWTVVLEKTLESPLDCRKIKPVNPKGNESWISISRTDAEADTPIFGHLMQRAFIKKKKKTPHSGKDWRQEKGTTEDKIVGWHHQFNGHEFEQVLGNGEGQGCLVCCSHGVTNSSTWLNDWTTTTNKQQEKWEWKERGDD